MGLMIFAKIKVSFCHTFKDRRFQKILKQPPVKQNGRPRDLLRATVIHSAAGNYRGHAAGDGLPSGAGAETDRDAGAGSIPGCGFGVMSTPASDLPGPSAFLVTAGKSNRLVIGIGVFIVVVNCSKTLRGCAVYSCHIP